MTEKIKKFWGWCQRHLFLVTILVIASLFLFTLVNIEILHMTSEPEFCAMCHPEQGHGPLAEVDSWEHSGHAEAGVSCLDCHGRPGPLGYMKAKLGGLKDTYMQFTITAEEKLEILSNPSPDLVPDEHCLFCHSDEGNRRIREESVLPLKIVKMRMLDTVINPEFRVRKGLPDILTDSFVGGTHFSHELHLEEIGLSCRDCHFGIVHRNQSKTDRMNFCLSCHAGVDGAPQMADCQTCHQAQFAMNEGQGAKDVKGEVSLMYGDDFTCQMCHTAVERGIFRPSSTSCTNCHDASYIDIFNEWAADTKARLKDLAKLRNEVESALIEADRHKRDTDANWQLYQKALFNLNFVRDDGTHGVHNNDYALDILAAVEKDFREVLKNLKQRW